MQLVTDGLVAHLVDNGETIYTLPVSSLVNMMLAHKADSERQYTAEQVNAEISRIIANRGRDGRLAAVKQYRIMTKEGLREAVDYVDAVLANVNGQGVRTAIETILVNGDASTETLICAIRRHREMTGSSLPVAKLYCERVRAELPVVPKTEHSVTATA